MWNNLKQIGCFYRTRGIALKCDTLCYMVSREIYSLRFLNCCYFFFLLLSRVHWHPYLVGHTVPVHLSSLPPPTPQLPFPQQGIYFWNFRECNTGYRLRMWDCCSYPPFSFWVVYLDQVMVARVVFCHWDSLWFCFLAFYCLSLTYSGTSSGRKANWL